MQENEKEFDALILHTYGENPEADEIIKSAISELERVGIKVGIGQRPERPHV